MDVWKLMVVLVLAMLLISPVLAQPNNDELRAKYARYLYELVDGGSPQVGGNDYAIECGDEGVVLPAETMKKLPGKEGVVCILTTDTDDRAIIFAQSESQGAPWEDVIKHFASYAPDIENDYLIDLQDVDSTACDDAPVDEWKECSGAINSRVKNSDKYHLYLKRGSLGVNTYLLTYDFTYRWEETFWQGIIDFFKDLLGIGGRGTSLTDDELKAFTRGYLAAVNKHDKYARRIHAFYYDNSGSSEAVIFLQHFVKNFSMLVTDPKDYHLASENRQVLVYHGLSIPEWEKLTAGLRPTVVSGTPVAGGVCGPPVSGGVPVLDYDEDCEVVNSKPIYRSGRNTCEALGFTGGELGCNPPGTKDSDGNDIGCTFNQSGCFSCEDKDGDGFPVAEGIPDTMRSVGGTVRLGSTLLDSSYDRSSGDYAKDKAARTALHLTTQAVPLPASHFLGTPLWGAVPAPIQSAVTSAAFELGGDYASCVDGGATSGSCMLQGLTSPQGLSALGAAGLGGHVATRMRTSNDITQGTPCTYTPTTAAWDCPSLAPDSIGYFGDRYEKLFEGLKSEGIKPVFVIDLGEMTDDDLNIPANRFRIAITCGALGFGARQTWADIPGGQSGVSLDTFLFNLQPPNTVDPTQYYAVYEVCRAGIKAGVDANAKLYYNPGAIDSASNNNYWKPLLDHVERSSASERLLLVDGLVVADVGRFAGAQEVFTIGNGQGAVTWTGAQLLRALGTSYIAMPIVTGATHDAATTAMLDALATNGRMVLFLGMKQAAGPLAAGTAPTVAGTTVKELFESLDGSPAYVPRLPSARMLVLHPHQPTQTTSVFIAGIEKDPLPQDIDFTTCDGIIKMPNATGAFAEPRPSINLEDFTTLPKDGLYKLEINDWTCFRGGMSLATLCSQYPEGLDCNDDPQAQPVTGDRIHPGAPELCNNAVDDDCDGFVDYADTCEPAIGGGQGCDFDRVCEDGTNGETPETCTDCAYMLTCPKTAVEALTFGGVHATSGDRGGFTYEVEFGVDGKPVLVITPTYEKPPGWNKNEPCELWGYHAGNTVTRFSWTNAKGRRHNLFYNGGSKSATGYLVETETGWRIEYEGGGSELAYYCHLGCKKGSQADKTKCIQDPVLDGARRTIAEINYWDFEPCGQCPPLENVHWQFFRQMGSYTIETGVMEGNNPVLRVTTSCRPVPGRGNFGGSQYCELANETYCAEQQAKYYWSYYFADANADPLYQDVRSGTCYAANNLGKVGFCGTVTADQVKREWVLKFIDEGVTYTLPEPWSADPADARACWGLGASSHAEIHVPFPTENCNLGCAETCPQGDECESWARCIAGCCIRRPGGGLGGGGCFTPETPILTPDGERPIGDLVVGDLVVSMDTADDSYTVSPITDIEKVPVIELLIINGRVRTTDVHRFFTQRGWVAGADLVVGDKLKSLSTEAGGWESIVRLEHVPYEGFVYNLHVAAEEHNFFAAGVLAHNLKMQTELPG